MRWPIVLTEGQLQIILTNHVHVCSDYYCYYNTKTCHSLLLIIHIHVHTITTIDNSIKVVGDLNVIQTTQSGRKKHSKLHVHGLTLKTNKHSHKR